MWSHVGLHSQSQISCSQYHKTMVASPQSEKPPLFLSLTLKVFLQAAHVLSHLSAASIYNLRNQTSKRRA